MHIAMVTGASSGMGREFVKIITKEHAVDEIWIIARRENRLIELEKQYPNVRFRTIVMDLTNEEDIKSLRLLLREKKPFIDAFVHCAGYGIIGDTGKIPAEEKMVDINVKAVVGLTAMVIPYISRDGRMIYIASAAAFLPQPRFATYAASKAFVLSYVRALKVELAAKRVKVTAVCPGPVKTEFFDIAEKYNKLAFYKKAFMADPARVVKKAWDDNLKGKEMSVYGFSMKAFLFITKVLPHRMILKLLEMFRKL